MQTGMIGLGAMGARMAKNLCRADMLHRVWNRSRAKADAFAAETGVEIAATPEDLAKDCKLILICVSRDADVLEIVERIAVVVEPGTIVADISTIAADSAKKAAGILRANSAYFLDCPVSGGVEGAQKGTLAMMVGGDEAVLEQARSVLAVIAARIVHLGPTGSGQACKAVNQLMAAGINQAVSEALAFGESMGLDMNKVIDTIATGAAGNWFLEHRGKTMLDNNYAPGFKLALHYKDLNICKAMLKALCDTDLPMLEATLLDYRSLIDSGYGDEDISTLLRVKRKLIHSREE